MKHIFSIIVLCILIPLVGSSQNVIAGIKTDPGIKTPVLDQNIAHYNIYRIDIKKSDIKITSNRRKVDMYLGDKYYNLNMFNNNVDISYESPNLPQLLGGSLNTGGSVSLTINDDFIYGFIRYGNDYIFIEPLKYFDKEADDNLFVSYRASDVIDTGEHKCGVEETEERSREHMNYKMPITTCKIIDFAIANAFDMYDEYNSVAAVENHNLGVLNNVQTNYRSEFDINIEFDVVAHFIPTSLGADPFPSSTNASTLLNSLTSWGSGGGNSGGSSGGFSVNYNQATLWTFRDICAGSPCNTGVVGLAWLPGWHSVLEDFSLSAASLMSLKSHELGHNFDAVHDGANFTWIMSPTVTLTPNWSPLSKTDISARLNTLTYLSDCSTMGAPVADFFQSVIPVCTNESVDFEDQSQYGATRSWEFFNGTPATSIDEKETVTYNTNGLHAVKILSTNSAGTDSTFKYVHVQAEPTINCSTNSPNGGTHGGIKGFFLENISNTSSGSNSSNEYSNFICDHVATLVPNTTYDFSANIGTCSPGCNPCEVLRLYIDYNGDGDFNDTGELAYTSGGGGWCGTQTHSFTTPVAPQLAETLRLRLISDNTIISSPCHNPTTGETEDYGVYFPDVQIFGCTDSGASNYDPMATIDDGTCILGSTTWYRDFDNDAFGNINDTQNSASQPAGYVADNTDCNDMDNTVYPGATELCDGQINNCNTGSLPLNEVDNDGDQYVECVWDAGGWDGAGSVIGGDDCDDNDANNYPGNTEVCDGQDNDCDGLIDEGVLNTYYEDNDGDGFGNNNSPLQACTQPGGYVVDNTDCNDGDNTVFPGASELCDGQINNCNTGSLPLNEIDNDNDQYVECTWDAGGWDGTLDVIGGDDCNDADNTQFPGNPEVCDGKDNDCNGQTDDGIGNTYYEDSDNDGFGNLSSTILACTQPAGYVTDNTDCDDTDNTVYPSAPELCDGQINDCNTGSLPADEVDNDSDGYVECIIDVGGWDGVGSVIGGNDCNDADNTQFPGNPEVCDGKDNDCNGQTDDGVGTTYYEDSDNDGFGNLSSTILACTQPAGYVTDNTDCDDTDNTVYPSAPELCDGQINDCNTGSLPTDEVDNDSDGYVECIIDVGGWDGVGSVIGGNDCNDADNTQFPGNPEVCDGKDNDCNGQTDDGVGTTYYEDSDNDGFGNLSSTILACTQPAGYVTDNTDCDDTDNTVYPSAPELCDGQINDCNTGSLPTDEVDNDSDGYVECIIDAGGWDGVGSVVGGDDCNDGNSGINPGANEICDGFDNDCDGQTDESCQPCDGDYLIINTITQNTYRAEINIMSDALVNNGQSILFTAGTDIDLNPDFEVVLGTEFEARIEDCIPGSFKEDDEIIYLKSGDTDELINQLKDHFGERSFQIEISNKTDNIIFTQQLDIKILKDILNNQVNGLSQGIYQIQFFDDNKVVAQKLAIIR